MNGRLFKTVFLPNLFVIGMVESSHMLKYVAVSKSLWP